MSEYSKPESRRRSIAPKFYANFSGMRQRLEMSSQIKSNEALGLPRAFAFSGKHDENTGISRQIIRIFTDFDRGRFVG